MKRTSLLAAASLIAVAADAQNRTPAPQATSLTQAADEKMFDDSFGKLPTNISSDSLTLHQKDRVFVYKGNVVVTQGDMTLTSKTLEGTYSEDNQIQRLVAKGDVVIIKQDIKATSQQALYDAKTATVTLLDTPQLVQEESILTADRIKVFLNENRSQAEGAVRVTIVNKEKKDKKEILSSIPGEKGANPAATPTGAPATVSKAAAAPTRPPSKATPAPARNPRR